MGDDPQAAASQKKRKINAEERREQDRLIVEFVRLNPKPSEHSA